MNMTNVGIDTIVTILTNSIEEKDAVKTLAVVLELKEKVRADPLTVKWITEPANIKEVHDLLVEHLDVSPKMMMLKNKVPNRQRRAHLFVQAIENGIRKVLGE